MSAKRETDNRLGPLLEYFAERLFRVYAHFFCVFEFEEDEDVRGDPGRNDRTWSLRTIQNACSHESLIALRDLDDFLTPRTSKSKPDDLKASDFGYPESRGFLTISERESINKLVAHTTMVGAQSKGFRWDIWELTSKCVAQSFEFLKWAESHYGLSHFLLFTAAIGCRTKTQKIHEYVAAQIAKRKK
jgi:hypothetical protein